MEAAAMTVDSALRQAGDALRTGRVQDAETLYKEILERDPNNTSAIDAMISLSLHRRDMNAASSYADQGLKISPSAHFYYRKGIVNHKLGDYPGARDCYDRALSILMPYTLQQNNSSIYQSTATVMLSLAFVHTELGDFETAESYVRRAAFISPTGFDSIPHLERIRFLKRRAKDPETARATAEFDATVTAINNELWRNPLYAPSEFWAVHGQYHVELIRRYGIGNFKRTVSHNYQNWTITSINDPQLQTMLAKWPTHGSAQPLLNDIETPSHVGYHSDLDFQTPEYFLATPDKREIYKLAVGLIWEFVAATDRFNVLQSLEELEVGNPVRIRRQGKVISSDLAHSVRERNLLFNNCGLTGDEALSVAELGAGSGRLAEVFGRTSNYRYYIFDIAPALYVAQWYIKKIFPNEKIFAFRPFQSYNEIADELSGCRFAFFSANQIEYMPDRAFDLFITMNSLEEMRKEQIANFLGQIDRLTKTAFLSRQWLKWANPWDRLIINKDDFSLGNQWTKGLDIIDEIYLNFFNHIWRRKSG